MSDDDPRTDAPGSEEREGAPPPLPEPSFLMLAYSLHAQALHHLGAMPEGEGEGERPEADLEHAKFTIDLLGVLQEKTKGNLDDEEERFLKGLLFELRMKFVEASR